MGSEVAGGVHTASLWFGAPFDIEKAHEMPPRVHFRGTAQPSTVQLSWKHGELQSMVLVMMSQRV
jgi:hypothetical protein